MVRNDCLIHSSSYFDGITPPNGCCMIPSCPTRPRMADSYLHMTELVANSMHTGRKWLKHESKRKKALERHQREAGHKSVISVIATPFCCPVFQKKADVDGLEGP
jgi:hypothetical protein